MRILLICDAFYAVGGVQEIVDHIARDMLGLGHQVAVFSTTPIDVQRLPRAPVDYVEFDIPVPKPVTWRHPERFFRHPKGFATLVEKIRQWRPDVVNAHGGVWDKFPVIAAACRDAGVPFVQSLHGASYRGRLGEKALRALKYASALTAASAYSRDFFASRVGAAHRARLLGSGVDIAAARAAVAPEHARPYLICAARFDLSHKAIDVLIEAFAALASRYPQLDLLLAGDGPDRAKIEAQIAACGLVSRVKLLGVLPLKQLWSLYKGATGFVMPSRKPEGLALALLEAMACGTPVIATNSGGTPEVIVHEANGLLVARNDPAEFAAAIAQLLDNREAGQQMGPAALETAARYDWREVTRGYLEVYESVARSRTAGRE
jgi:glycosyltransferase involved in cell wall biosynthesis